MKMELPVSTAFWVYIHFGRANVTEIVSNWNKHLYCFEAIIKTCHHDICSRKNPLNSTKLIRNYFDGQMRRNYLIFL